MKKAPCSENLICVRSAADDHTRIHAIDTDTGETRWVSEPVDADTHIMPVGSWIGLFDDTGTRLVDPSTGETTHSFTSEAPILIEDDYVVAADSGQLLFVPSTGNPEPAGPLPSVSFEDRSCEWSSTHVLCAEEYHYSLWAR